MTGPRSEEFLTAMFGGVTISTLAEIFGLDVKEANKRLVGKAPTTPSKDKFTRYRIRDAAPFLVESQIDPEELFKNLPASKWPPQLQDAFWKAQNNRLKYEESRGELWRTERVYGVITDAFKVIRMTLMMMSDTVEQRTELSPQQRAIIQELCDGMLSSLRQKLREEFAFYDPPADEHGPPLNISAAIVVDAADDEEEEHDPFA